MTDERIVSPETNETEELIEKSLRPQFLAQYIGQNKVKEELSIYIQAAKNREEALDHVLLYGPPGLERRQWRWSSPMKWRSTSRRLVDLLSKSRET